MTGSSTSLWRNKARRGIPSEAYGGIPTARPVVSDIQFAGGATELHQTVTEFHDEVDECVRQERRGWDEECV
jgi:hypothetical protein